MKEIIVFRIVLVFYFYFVTRSASQKQLKLHQGLAMVSLIIFLSIVFAFTVFTRMPTVRRCELILFCSRYEVIMNHSRSLFFVNFLNILLLVPVGLLLPIIFDKKSRPYTGFLIDALISAAIEVSQLIFRRKCIC